MPTDVHFATSLVLTMLGMPAATQVEAYWEDDDAFYPGVLQHCTEDGMALVLYKVRDEERLCLAENSRSPSTTHL